MATTSLIDVEFGISQLSGNKELFLTLLGKFSDEYQNTVEKVNELVKQQAWSEARVLVHTIKGVAGNLGCNELHASCKVFEGELKQGVYETSSHVSFDYALTATIEMIAALQSPVEVENTPAPQKDEVVIDRFSARDSLLTALRANEFIPPDQLDAWLDGLGIDSAQRQNIIEAVDDLDYPEAEQIVANL